VSHEVITEQGRPRLVLRGAVDIVDAASLWRALMEVAAQETPVEVDLRQCVDVDTAVLQLLLALRRSRDADGRATAFVGASERLQRSLARFQILGDPEMAPQTPRMLGRGPAKPGRASE
jgi:ABC-type transporter Mla MlaB component